jgi:hypothetical protein
MKADWDEFGHVAGKFPSFLGWQLAAFLPTESRSQKPSNGMKQTSSKHADFQLSKVNLASSHR